MIEPLTPWSPRMMLVVLLTVCVAAVVFTVVQAVSGLTLIGVLVAASAVLLIGSIFY